MGGESLAGRDAGEAGLKAAETLRREATMRGDMATLERLTGDPFRYVHIDGLVDDRAGYLNRIATGDVVYPFTGASEMEAVIRPGYALLSGVSTIAYRWADGRAEGEFRALFTSVWEYRDAAVGRAVPGWRIMAYASSPMPQERGGPD